MQISKTLKAKFQTLFLQKNCRPVTQITIRDNKNLLLIWDAVKQKNCSVLKRAIHVLKTGHIFVSLKTLQFKQQLFKNAYKLTTSKCSASHFRQSIHHIQIPKEKWNNERMNLEVEREKIVQITYLSEVLVIYQNES